MDGLFIVNPVSGLGGTVGLKGSDGPDRQAEALRRGAIPKASDRAKAFIERLSDPAAMRWIAPPGVEGLEAEVYEVPDRPDRTQEIVRQFKDGVDLIVFVGGDGTARDVLAALGESETLCLGIPAGVKMHSGVFAVSPQAAATIVDRIVTGELVTAVSREVRDYDDREEGIVSYGELRIPEAAGWLQQTKVGGKENEALAVEDIVADVQEHLSEFRPLVFGPGSTMFRIKEAFGLEGTLRGFDVLTADGVLVDVGEQALLALGQDAHYVISFAKDQGFLLGRGNQQLSARVLQALDFSTQVTVVATRTKISSLAGRPLLVDTGDTSVDKSVQGICEITSGYEDRLIYRIESASG